jgi:DNA-binding CsgD family transcriptional regulator
MGDARTKATRPLDTFAFGSFRVVSIDATTLAPLSLAERAVVALAVLGLSNKDIGARRGSSARTVANQLASAYRKLVVGSRAELVARLEGTATPK